MKIWKLVCVTRYNDVILCGGPIMSKWNENIYTHWCNRLIYSKKKRKSVTNVMYKRPHIHLVQCSPALTAGWRGKKERKEQQHVPFNLIYLQRRFICIPVCCAQCKAFQQTITVVQIRFFYTYYLVVFLLVLHCCKWCFCSHGSFVVTTR